MRRANAILVLSTILCACLALPQVEQRDMHDAATFPPAVNERADTQRVLRLGSWNVRKLGFDASKDVPAIAHIIDAHFDLVALQEVMYGAEPALAALLSALGPAWSMQSTASARPPGDNPHAEHYVFVYRVAQLAPCAELSELRFLDELGDTEASALFLRPPALACYRTREGALDFLVANYHARWGSGDPVEIGREVEHIDRCFARMEGLAPGEQQRFVLGDFNLTSQALRAHTRAVVAEASTGSTLDARGNVSPHRYDHLLAFGATSAALLLGDARVLDVRTEANDPESFRARISDHLPLAVSLLLSEDDD